MTVLTEIVVIIESTTTLANSEFLKVDHTATPLGAISEI